MNAHPKPVRLISALGATLALTAAPALATWSIILVNVKTGEVAIGQATCLPNFDLQKASAVVVVGKGAACAQSFIDTTGQNRLTIFQDFQTSTPLAQILTQLIAQDPSYQTRQYGMVALYGGGDSLTFTGTACGAFANGVVGQVGDIRYAIQGNVLTGQPVITAAENAILTSPGDVGQKLLSAMRAAQTKGGDGRCSCSPSAPTSCGSPPPNFTKAADVAYILTARIGDVDGTCNSTAGCANGTYYMDLAYIGGASSPDPVLQLIPLYNAWRAGWVGHADHVKSKVTFDKAGLTADGASQATMTIQLFDINGTAITTGAAAVTVAHDASSAGSCAIGPVQNLGNGSYQVLLTAGTTKGLDVFRVVANDGKGNVLLYPLPKLALSAPCASYGAGTPGTGGLTPILDCVGASVLGNANFGFAASNVLTGAPVSFCASYGTANIPFGSAGVLLVDPFNLAWIGGPIVADGAGNAPVAAPIPNDVSLTGMHVFAQALAFDAGGEIGLSASQGLDIEIN
jgi:uncharacterized Ntn-hydrolase superfamily protein